MPDFSGNIQRFRRGRFSARFPGRFLYTMSHFWLSESSPGTWRIGLTRFAVRMLGEVVEFEFVNSGGAPVEVGEPLGWIEGLKAASDIFSAAQGEFAACNPEALDDPALIFGAPHGAGWLYAVKGAPDSLAMDVRGYTAYLEEIVDSMQSGSCSLPREAPE